VDRVGGPVDTLLVNASTHPTRHGLTVSTPDVGLAIVFLAAWVVPGVALLPGVASWLVVTMILEFIAMHSMVVMWIIAQQKRGPHGDPAHQLRMVGAIYAGFVCFLSIGARTPWPLLTFWAQWRRRVRLVTAPADGRPPRAILVGWGISFLFFMTGAFATAAVPVPRLAITASVTRAIGLDGSGLWIDEPQRAIAFGFLYYAATALSEAVGHRWVPAAIWGPAPVAATGAPTGAPTGAATATGSERRAA
jgi:hypothetical protein